MPSRTSLRLHARESPLPASSGLGSQAPLVTAHPLPRVDMAEHSLNRAEVPKTPSCQGRGGWRQSRVLWNLPVC